MMTKRQKRQEPIQIKKTYNCKHCGKNTEKSVYIPRILEEPLYFCSDSCLSFYLENEKQLHKYKVVNKQLSTNLVIVCCIQIILAVTYFSIFRFIPVPEYYLYLETVGIILSLITIAGSVATLLWYKPEV